MKRKVILIALVTAAAVGCHPKNSATETTTTQTTVTQDTAGLSQFQQWKAQHELASPNQYNPQGTLNQSSNNAAYGNSNVPQHGTTYSSTVPQHHRSNVYSSTTSSSHTATAYRKRGWSHGAKDAVIGGVGGAVIGVIADKKNRGVGGVIGGVVGAAAGYGIGHHKDKKQGRY